MMSNKRTGALSNYICSNGLIEIGGEFITLRHGSFKLLNARFRYFIILLNFS